MAWKIFMVRPTNFYFGTKLDGKNRVVLGVKPREWFDANPDKWTVIEQCFAHDEPDFEGRGLALPPQALPVGAAYFDPEWHSLSAGYNQIWKSQRHPLLVKLPSSAFKGGEWFCVDQPERGQPIGGQGWEVVGVVPKLTLAPSINCEGRYHGRIQNGIIADDCEGRAFPQFPSTA